VATLKCGVAIGRRAARLVVYAGNERHCSLLLDREIERNPDTAPSKVLERLLVDFPETFKKAGLAVALSSGDCACDDVWKAPDGVRIGDLGTVAPVLLEARATGDTLEQLAIDVRLRDGELQAVALPSKELLALKDAAEAHGTKLRLITGLPAAMADVFPQESLMAVHWAGQRIEVERREGGIGWRSVPIDGAEATETASLAMGGILLGSGQAAGTAAAFADPETVPDALRGSPDAPRSFGERFRKPLAALAGALVLALLSSGLVFRMHERRSEAELAAARRLEGDLWKRFFPGEKPVPGELLRVARERLRTSGSTQATAGNPSAFVHFVDLARHLPEAEGLGMSLESLDLTPEGGRMSATVSAVQGDTLRNAALLEARISESSRITARGDFEARATDIQVRIKMDWRGR